jgi:hypothetical protein
MSNIQEACDAVERWPKVITIPRLDGTGVQRHAYCKHANYSPRLQLKHPLSGDRGCQGVRRLCKRRQHAITSRLDDLSLMGGDRLCQDRIVASKCSRHCIGVLFPESCAAFDIRE